MRIHCPMNPEYVEHVDELVELGADEFYLGYVNESPDSLSILSLRLAPHSNFPSRGAALDAVAKIKSTGKTSFITVNGPFYPKDYYDTLVEDIRVFSENGADGFIVSDVGLFLRLRRSLSGLYLAASSGAHVLNLGAVDFMASLGAKRCILPRQLSVGEIRAIVSARPDMDFEIFVKNEECAFLDGHCSYSHYGEFDYKPACNELFGGDTVLRAGRAEMWSCGACVLYELRGMDNLSLKIVGRALRYEPIRKDVAFICGAMDTLETAESREDYRKACRALHQRTHGIPCGEKCYYDPKSLNRELP